MRENTSYHGQKMGMTLVITLIKPPKFKDDLVSFLADKSRNRIKNTDIFGIMKDLVLGN